VSLSKTLNTSCSRGVHFMETLWLKHALSTYICLC